MQGTPFQKLVWELLLQIPYGETITYGELAGQIAAQLGRTSMSAQAVGGAVGHNKISILIPCHRVVGRDQSLTGYAGGLERKKWLLELEKGKHPVFPWNCKGLKMCIRDSSEAERQETSGSDHYALEPCCQSWISLVQSWIEEKFAQQSICAAEL